MSKKVLIIAAHTDDEALGCGGTIAKHTCNGDKVYAAFLADGVSSRTESDQYQFDSRNAAAKKAHQILGITETFMLGFPDNQLDTIALLEVIQALEAIIQELRPEIIYTHHGGDLNIDHQITNKAALTACRPLPGSSIKEIHAFEVLSSTDWADPGNTFFQPNLHIDITETINTKIDALEAYQLEMRAPPHSRSIEHIQALAISRGHTIGTHYAESFMTLRAIR